MNAIDDAIIALRGERAALHRRIDKIDQAIDLLAELAEIAEPRSDIRPEEFPADVTPAPTDPPAVKKAAPVADGRRYYTDDEKNAAARLADDIGPKRASDQLGISDTVINRWRREGRGQISDSVPTPEAPKSIPERRPNPIERSRWSISSRASL